jgi:mannose-6-phosphate isomerase-like protein (cupin superfamily)
VSDYTKANLRSEVENASPKFGMPEGIEARFARRALAGETLGVSHMTLGPGFRVPFAHKHSQQEEVYVVVRGSGRVKVGDEVVELSQWDAIRFGRDVMRQMEGGPDGMEYIAFGAGTDAGDAEIEQGWWTD